MKAEGVGGLYRGFWPALARSFPANGACFMVYELVSTALKSTSVDAPAEVLANGEGR